MFSIASKCPFHFSGGKKVQSCILHYWWFALPKLWLSPLLVLHRVSKNPVQPLSLSEPTWAKDLFSVMLATLFSSGLGRAYGKLFALPSFPSHFIGWLWFFWTLPSQGFELFWLWICPKSRRTTQFQTLVKSPVAVVANLNLVSHRVILSVCACVYLPRLLFFAYLKFSKTLKIKVL